MRKRRELPKEPFEAEITDLTHDGRGVAHVNNLATFIFGALPGERVRFRYTFQNKSYAEGETLAVLTPAPERVTPQCPYFGTCGGCSFQHASHDFQLVFKQSLLSKQLKQFGKTSPEEGMMAPTTGPEWSYRHKARVGIRFDNQHQKLVMGFRHRRKHYLVDIDHCAVMEKRLSEMLLPFKKVLASLSIPHDLPQIEVAAAENGVAIILRHLKPLTENDKKALVDFVAKQNIHLYTQSKGPDSIIPLYPTHPPLLYYTLPEYALRFEFHPSEFTQINPAINEKMVTLALEALQTSKEDTVLDLFCGLGNFSLPLARGVKHVVGVEGDDRMVQRASQNASANGISNTSFFAANLFEIPQDASWVRSYPKLLLDPPRAGAFEVAKQIERFDPTRIVYISCNPATLARDTEVFIQKGYILLHAGILDMFPQTGHVESIAVFEKRHYGKT